jgi:hypothetical protein
MRYQNPFDEMYLGLYFALSEFTAPRCREIANIFGFSCDT